MAFRRIAEFYQNIDSFDSPKAQAAKHLALGDVVSCSQCCADTVAELLIVSHR